MKKTIINNNTDEIIEEKFSDLIREKMNDKQFKKWVNSWFDGNLNYGNIDEICSIAENWDIEDKKETLKEYNLIK
jgi:hypothetical protein